MHSRGCVIRSHHTAQLVIGNRGNTITVLTTKVPVHPYYCERLKHSINCNAIEHELVFMRVWQASERHFMRVRTLWQIDSKRTLCPNMDGVSLRHQCRSNFSKDGIQFTEPFPAKRSFSRQGISKEARARSCEVDCRLRSLRTQRREHPGHVSGLA